MINQCLKRERLPSGAFVVVCKNNIIVRIMLVIDSQRTKLSDILVCLFVSPITQLGQPGSLE